MLQRLIKLVNQLGFINGMLYLLNRISTRLSLPFRVVKYYFVSQKFSQDKLLPNGKGKKLDTRELSVKYQYNHPCPRPVSVIQDRYAQGAVCLATFKQEEFAGCLWYIKDKFQEDEVRCCYDLISDLSVWDFDVYVAPKYRLSPVFLKLWDEVSERLMSEGYQYSVSRISAFNAMSLASHRRMGAKPLAWSVFVCIGSSQFTLSNLSPYFHLSFKATSFPVFKLNTQKIKHT